MGMDESHESRRTESTRDWLPYSLWVAVAFAVACPIVCIWLLFFCPAPTPPTETPNPDGKKTCEEFTAAIKSYPYEASQARKDRIVKNYPKLEVGMSKDQVAGWIGDPDYSRLDYGPKGPNEKWLGSSWYFYLHKTDDGANLGDPCVEIFFGTDDRATWIVPSNIDGLKEKGSPSRQSNPP
jgi:hypothetical protein